MGRIVNKGKPLAGAAVGAAQKSRSPDTFLGDFKAATDSKGVFRIPNLPAEDVLMLYGLMDSLRPQGAIAARAVRTGASRSEVDMGDIDVTPGFRCSGTVVLKDGKQVPAGTRILLSRMEAWDHQIGDVDKEGAFRFTGLPKETYTLSVHVAGYYLSPRNVSRCPLNTFHLLGVVAEDIEGLRVLFEPGQEPESGPSDNESDQKRFREFDKRHKTKLQGAPG